MKSKRILTFNRKLFVDTLAALFSFILMILATIFAIASWSVWLWATAFLVGGMAKAIEGVKKTIQEKSLNVEFLMIAAALAAFLTGEYAEGAILIFIFAVSGVLEEFATSQSEKALTKLLHLAPKKAIRVQNGIEEEIDVAALNKDDHVIVKPGQQIPADGIIVDGGASIDESSITGEFSPVSKLTHDLVYGGTIVTDSVIYVKVLKNPEDSVVQKIITLVAKAQADKTKTENRITLFEKFYVYGVILLSLTVIFLTPTLGWLSSDEAFRRGVIILVVASPCALVASVSPAILSTLSHAARKGILIKGGRYLESLLKIKVVAFDKTGTITTGKPKVVNVIVSESALEKEVVSVVTNMERNSTHPLAKAISEHFSTTPVRNLVIKEMPGKGLQADVDGVHWQVGRFEFKSSESIKSQYLDAIKLGQTIVFIIREGTLAGFVSLTDTIRSQAKPAITKLKQLGIQSLMLTGDTIETAHAIASHVGIDNVRGNCLPEDKLAVIQSYANQGKPILMIGDGINDSPSLAAATLGVSMGDATDVSLETADIIMMNNNLENIPYLFRLARKMKLITLQNIAFSMTVIGILLTTNLFGFIELRSGVISHEVSTILVVLNSLRLLKIKKS
jgi:Cd2+/Zn2+-exporting ATPase